MKSFNKAAYSAALFFIVLFLSLNNSRAQKIHYNVDLSEAAQSYITINLEISGLKNEDSLRLKMATWTPGSYLIREFSKHVSKYSASDKNGKVLKSYKENKNTWVVLTQNNSSVNFEYRVYARELSVRTNFVNEDLALLNGTATFIYPEGKINTKSSIEFKLPDLWSISTSLGKFGNTSFEASNYDELFDSPFLMGNQTEMSFEEAGVKHRIAIHGVDLYDGEMIISDFRKIVSTQTSYFGENPNKEYVFLIIGNNSGGGGLEHLSSSTMIVDRLSLVTESGYRRFLGLISHEYFHLWNVKRLRHESLGPFDYENENYTRDLWLLEGFTSYYGSKTLYDAGIYDSSQFVNRICNNLEYRLNKKGFENQSLAESSLDAWIKGYRPEENYLNTTVSYYSGGMSMGVLLDLMIIRKSNGEKDLDQFMKHLYDKFYKEMNKGFSSDELKKELNEFTGQDFSEYFDSFIYGNDTDKIKNELERIGFELMPSNRSFNNLGMIIKNDDEHYSISKLEDDSPARKAGLNVEDKLIALDGHEFTMKNLSFFTQLKNEGDELTLTIIRKGKLMNKVLVMEKGGKISYEIGLKSSLTEEQETIFEKYLNRN